MRVKYFLIIIALVLAIGGILIWRQVAVASIGSLNIYSGSVNVERKDQSLIGNTGMAVKLIDTLSTASGSRAAIVLKDGSVIRLGAGSQVQVEQLSYQGSTIKQARFKLIVGRLWSHVEPMPQGSEFEVETPTTVATVRGTGLNTDYNNSLTIVFLNSNSLNAALASSPLESKAMFPGQWFVISDSNQKDDFAKGPEPAPPEYFDDWILFNQAEDAKLGEAPEFEIPSLEEEATSSSTKTEPIAPKPAVKTTPKQTLPPPQPQPQPQPSYLSLVLRSNKATLTTGEAAFLKVFGKKPDGTLVDVPFGEIQWNQSPELGVIQSPGYYSGQLVGTAKLTARVGDLVSNEIVIEIKKPVTKQMSGFGIAFVKSQSKYSTYYQLPTAQFSATAYYNDGTNQDVTAQAKWSVSGTAEGTISSSGFYQPGNQGSDTVSAEYNGFGDSAVIAIP